MTQPSASAATDVTGTPTVPVSVVIPVRNAAGLIGDCLASVVAARPAEVVVVDGGSTDGTLETVAAVAATTAVPVRVLDDGGAGVSGARTLGVREARSDVVALVDADIVLSADDALARWLEEFEAGGWTGLQAELAPESADGDYWSECLAFHQATGRSRHWFTLCASMMDRSTLLEHGFDDSFKSGEDIELRHRFQRAGHRVGVSDRVRVRHRFEGGWDAAMHQWDDDGAGLARTVLKNGVRDLPLLGIPLAGFARGVLVTAWRRPSMLGYWLCYLLFNYRSMARTLLGGDGRAGVAGNSLLLTAARVLPMALGFGTWLLVARWFTPTEVGHAALGLTVATLTTHVAAGGTGHGVIVRLPGAEHPRRLVLGSLLATVVLAGAVASAAAALLVAGDLAPRSAAGWVVGVAVALSAAYFVDHVAIARERSLSVLARTVLQAAVLLGALVVLHGRLPDEGVAVVLGATAAGAVASVLAGLTGAFTAVERTATGVRSGGAAAQLAVTLAHRGPMLALPLVVAAVGTAEDAAVWYVVWMLWLAVWFVPNSVATSTQARLARTPAVDWPPAVRRSRRLALGAGLVAAAGAALAGPLLLAVMGEEYGDAWPVLLLLLAGVVPAAVTEPALAARRAGGRVWSAVLWWAAAGVAAVAAILLLTDGLVAVAGCWLAGQCLLALAVRSSPRLVATTP